MIPTYDSRISLMIYKLSPVAKLPSKIALFDTWRARFGSTAVFGEQQKMWQYDSVVWYIN